MTPKIDPEFRSLIPPLRPDERAGLEAGIVKDGLLSPLIVWDGHNTLLDGHNRLEICESLGMSYKTESIQLESRNAAKLWIVTHQLNRRNLTDLNRIALAKQAEGFIAAKAKANQKDHGGTAPGKSLLLKSGEVIEPIRTDKAAAALAGVSHQKYAQGVLVLESGTPELIQAVNEGVISVNAASKVAILPEDEQLQAIEAKKEAIEAKKQRRAKTDVVPGKKPKKPKRRKFDAPPGKTPCQVVATVRGQARESDGQSDSDWLITLPLEAKLRNQPLRCHGIDALAYRYVEAILKNADRKTPYMGRLKAFRDSVCHPRDWALCPTCLGETNGKPCDECGGFGYLVTTTTESKP